MLRAVSRAVSSRAVTRGHARSFPSLTTRRPDPRPKPQTAQKEERAREGVSPTAATGTDRREAFSAGEASPEAAGKRRVGEGERLGAEARGEGERPTGRTVNETRVKGTTSDEDAKGDARGDVFDAATEGREPDAAASPRGATRDRPDDEPHMGVSRDPRVSKKPRLVWTPELHMRFMNAVNHLGIKRAVPKTILSLMNVEGMTRENVASHLQKYRLYLKRLAGLSPNAPLPADIMQRAQPYSAFTGSA